jgi:hypothetical protein
MNWEQYLLELSINTWQRYLVLGKMAEDAGFTLSQESLAELQSIRTEMEASAKERGLDSADALIAQEMGEGVTLDDYIAYMELYYLGEEYFAQVYNNVPYTQQDLENYYTANLEALTTARLTKEAGYIGDVRHILIMPEGGELDANGNKVYTEEALQEALKEAENIKAMWDNGGKTEELFIDLTGKYTQDTGYDYNGGLYTDIYSESSYVPEFLAWAIDPENKPGDCEIVRTDYGYHIMYMIGNEPSPERIKGYNRASAVMLTVGEKPEAYTVAAKKLATDWPESLEFHIGPVATDGIWVNMEIADSPLEIWKHLAVKLAFNCLSTGTMASMGRVAGNWMSWVSISNKKLIDRGIRLLIELGGVSYEEAAQRIFAAEEWVAAQDWTGKEEPSAVQVALMQLRKEKAAK